MMEKISQPKTSVSSSSNRSVHVDSLVSKPGENDVLLGRGGGANNHSGNKKFRKLVQAHKRAYMLAPKSEKPNVARQVVKMWRQLKPQGRFLARHDKQSANESEIPGEASNFQWYDVGDKKAREKTSQCLREVTPDMLHLMNHRFGDKSHRKTPQKALHFHPVYENAVAKTLEMLASPQRTPPFDSRYFLPAIKQNIPFPNLGQNLPQSLTCMQFNPSTINQINEAMGTSKLQRDMRRQQIILVQQSLLQVLKQQH